MGAGTGPDSAIRSADLTAGRDALVAAINGSLRPARVTVRFGSPIPAAALFERCRHDRRGVMDTIGRTVAAQLPPAYRGVYAA